MTFAKRLTRIIDRMYWRPFRFLSKQTFRYLACGGLNWVISTLVYAGSYNWIFLRKDFDLGFIVVSPHIAALSIQLPVTFLVGFWLQKNISFKSAPLRNATQLFRYLLSSLVALLLTYVCMKFFVEVCHIYPTPSNVITYMVTAIFSFVAQKYYTFRGAEKE
jgi:putative flippase GtrA